MLGVLLWALTWLINRELGIGAPGITDPMQLAEPPDLSASVRPLRKSADFFAARSRSAKARANVGLIGDRPRR